MKEKVFFIRLILICFGISLYILNSGCKKKSDNSTDDSVVITTTAVTNISYNTATSGGTISSESGSSISARGICWSTNQNPTLADNKSSDGTGSGSFSSNIYGLTPNTPYYVRAYATNNSGTTYGSQVTFTTLALTPGLVLDFDGNIYHTMTIGSQTWLVENLKVTHYNNGDTIPHGNGKKDATGHYWNYGDDESNGQIYGHLYNYYAGTDSRGIAPLGYRVPSDSDWTVLSNYLAPDSTVGGKLKATGTSYWNSPNLYATNETGFSALPGGAWSTLQGFYFGIGMAANFWTTTSTSAYYAYGRGILNNSGYLNRGDSQKAIGWSIRCLKNN